VSESSERAAEEGDPIRDSMQDLISNPMQDWVSDPIQDRIHDRISVKGLRARGRHGVLAAERELGQEFIVDVTLFLDTAPAAAGDDLTKTVHYGELAQDLVKVVEGEPVDLIETLAQRLADVCLAHEIVSSAEISVHKPAAPIPLPFDDVIVTITRSRA
jgi:7,8-dihydroneopterin aldolase/epimerase/oxygenase